MLFPAGAEGGGEVAVAGAVDLFDPGAQPVDGFVAFLAVELPPLGDRGWPVPFVRLFAVAGGGQAGEPGGERGYLLVEPVEGIEDGRLPRGRGVNAVDAGAGVGGLAGQFG